MKVLIQSRAYSERFREFFAPHQMDLGHDPEMISAIDEEWYSIMVIDGNRALAHAVTPKKIAGTDFCDVEPFMGYGGLLINSNDQSFLGDALAAYSEASRELKVIAEFIRFAPLLSNHVAFSNRPELDIVAAKDVIVVDCEEDHERQISHFSSACRRRLRRGLETCQARVLDKATEIKLFRDLYESSLSRIGASKQWLLPDRFYTTIAASPQFEIQTVWTNGALAAAAIVGHHTTGSHYLLAAHSEDYAPGAGERLIYEITRSSNRLGIKRLILGGGNTPASDDSLLRYKSRYAKESTTFFVGMMIHDRMNFEMLNRQAIMLQPQIESQKYFLKYRLLPNGI